MNNAMTYETYINWVVDSEFHHIPPDVWWVIFLISAPLAFVCHEYVGPWLLKKTEVIHPLWTDADLQEYRKQRLRLSMVMRCVPFVILSIFILTRLWNYSTTYINAHEYRAEPLQDQSHSLGSGGYWYMVFLVLICGIVHLPQFIIAAQVFFALALLSLALRDSNSIDRNRAQINESLNEQREKAERDRQEQIADEQARRQQHQGAQEREKKVAEDKKAAAVLHWMAARHGCETLYNKFRPGILERWPYPEFKKYLDTYLTIDVPDGVLYRRAEDIQKVITFHGERLDGANLSAAQSLDELHKRVEEQRNKMTKLNLDKDLFDELLSDLNISFQSRAKKIMERI